MTLVKQPQDVQFSEQKPGGIRLTWALQGLVMLKSQVGPICCPSSSCPPSHPLALLDVKEIPALGRQPGSHTGLV